ncbi:dTDP-glucose 4,6-dehydratase [Allisonella histaminiformans]|uniref:dTDP-glucose 4,6-dehydratase n=1 Tax=Allisonella histaminiformans TaxID=209880 RepID=UPI002E79278E|nr:dTDP-glucose 4,6-dehydratase [Allisonella histaminiformans]
MKRNILITGIYGFIGANFAIYWNNHYPDDRIIGIDKMTYAANPANLDSIARHANMTCYRGDIADAAFVQSVFKKERPQWVVNFAAESHVDRSINNPELFIHSNVLGVSVLMDACLRFGVNRFHQVSTDEVYGDLSLSSTDAFKEEAALHPSSPYAASKASADLLVLSYARTYGLPITISRCSNNYGRFQHREKLIPKVIDCACRDISIPVYGRGDNRRDWIHVDDHCTAIDYILHKGKENHIYNVSAHEEINNLELIRKILAILGKSDDLITFVNDRPGHDRRYAMDTSRLEKLGWKAARNLDDFLNTLK